MTAAPRTVVIVPTFNERENLPTVVAALMQQPNVAMLIVDDRSPDGTGDLADELARAHPGRIEVLHRTERPGLGRSYIDGIAHVLGQPFDMVCQMDCDLSHDPHTLPTLIAAASDADMVIGSRYIPGGSVVNWPRRRQLLSRFANLYIRSITQMRVSDCTSGFRCWRRDALAKMPLDRFGSEGYSFLVEMLYAASRLGFRIAEVPITFVERRQGESKLSSGVLFESLLTPWRLVATKSRG